MFKLAKIGMMCLCVLALAGAAFALPITPTGITTDYSNPGWDYVQTYDFGGQWAGTDFFGDGSVSWTHTHPFSVPPDVVTSAQLRIDAMYVDTDGNSVEIEGFTTRTLAQDNVSWSWSTWSWQHSNDGTIIDLGPGYVDQSVWADGALGVTINVDEDWCWDDLRIDGSTLAMNTSTDARPTPEPLTLSLFGLGLAGLGVVRRFKK